MGILVKGLGKKFGSFEALKFVDLTINDGEFVAVLGPSGCGKTTLLRLLAGFEKPTSGEIHMNGALVARSGFALPPEKRKIGMVFQAFALWPHLNVLEVCSPRRFRLNENVTLNIEESLKKIPVYH